MTAVQGQNQPTSDGGSGLDLALVSEVASEVRSWLQTDAPLEYLNDQTAAESRARHLVNTTAADLIASGRPSISETERSRLVERILDDIFGYSGFTALLEDEAVENIFANGHDEVWTTRSGEAGFFREDPVCENNEALRDLITEWARKFGQTARQFNTRNPRLDLRLPGGQRLHAIMSVTEEPTVTIRCPARTLIDLDKQVASGMLSIDMADFLDAALRARLNVIVAGGTSTGKTTLLRSVLLGLPVDERIVVLEDTAELHLRRHLPGRNIVEMETRQANSEGVGAIGLLELTKECLRMSPDRVMVGEVRGAEAVYMLKAMSQGNDGSMCTLHAESVEGVLSRLRIYCSEGDAALPLGVIDGLYSTAVDLVIHLKSLPGRRRVVSAIAEVLDDTGEYNFLFGPNPTGRGQRNETGPKAVLATRLAEQGYHWQAGAEGGQP